MHVHPFLCCPEIERYLLRLRIHPWLWACPFASVAYMLWPTHYYYLPGLHHPNPLSTTYEFLILHRAIHSPVDIPSFRHSDYRQPQTSHLAPYSLCFVARHYATYYLRVHVLCRSPSLHLVLCCPSYCWVLYTPPLLHYPLFLGTIRPCSTMQPSLVFDSHYLVLPDHHVLGKPFGTMQLVFYLLQTLWNWSLDHYLYYTTTQIVLCSYDMWCIRLTWILSSMFYHIYSMLSHRLSAYWLFFIGFSIFPSLS
jgi:hypothetical protein